MAGTLAASPLGAEARNRWTIPEVAKCRVAASGDKVFLRTTDGTEETYASFWRSSCNVAAALQEMGIIPGERIVTLAFNGPPALHIWMATALIGAVDVSVNTAYRGEPLRHALNLGDPLIVVVDASLLVALESIQLPVSLKHIIVIGQADALSSSCLDGLQIHSYETLVGHLPVLDSVSPVVRPSDIATVVFTSGTTGPSKGVLMPHAQVCLVAHQVIEATLMSESDIFYCAHPLFHMAGKFMGVYAIFAAGGTLVLETKFDAEVWLRRIREYNVTVSILHGPMVEMIYAQPPSESDRSHSLRSLICCPLPRNIGSDFLQRFEIVSVEAWGMSEIGCPCWTDPLTDYLPGSSGKVLQKWYELAIVDPDTDEPVERGGVGEIVVRPKYPWAIMQGYMGMPEATLEAWRNLWFHTGDSAYLDRDGNLFYLDRLGDRIRRRAENISSYDIESAAEQHPLVRESAAVGIRSEYQDDDDIKLFVVVRRGETIEPLVLLDFVSQRLPYFMIPRYIEIIDELPRTPTNKVRKKELRKKGITSKTWDRKAAGVSLRNLIGRD